MIRCAWIREIIFYLFDKSFRARGSSLRERIKLLNFLCKYFPVLTLLVLWVYIYYSTCVPYTLNEIGNYTVCSVDVNDFAFFAARWKNVARSYALQAKRVALLRQVIDYFLVRVYNHIKYNIAYIYIFKSDHRLSVILTLFSF